MGLCASGMAAFLSLLPLGLRQHCHFVLDWRGLGLLTVTLVTHLRQWTGNRNPSCEWSRHGHCVFHLQPSRFLRGIRRVQSAVSGACAWLESA